ncbi:LamG domain-containing protein [Nostoc sp. PA-18-2419]|uniref:LamG domain-containing protein n=1 Tax=Nostoc sp. PA-18-2419 TaxID=2575443 RepID=UPI001108D30D|nr:LamG domain-containing protein [Nostoc sp. PA-18-2419]
MPLWKQPIELSVDLTEIETTVESLDTRLIAVESNIADKISLPTITKNIAANTDYFIGIDNNGQFYKISKADLLAGLSNGSIDNGNGSGYIAGVSALLPFNNSIADIKGGNIVINGNAQISNEQSKYYDTSLRFSGNNSQLVMTLPHGSFNGDFSVEFWYFFTALGNVDQDLFGTNDFSLLVEWDGSESKLRFKCGSVNLYPNSNTLVINNWHHLKFSRLIGSVYMFIDGVVVASSAIAVSSFTENILIGTVVPGRNATGYMSEFRSSLTGISSSFSPPTNALPVT